MLPVIASFLGVDVDTESLERIARMSSKEFMSDPKHAQKFDETWTYKR